MSSATELPEKGFVDASSEVDNVGDRLAQKLICLAEDLDKFERLNLNILLSIAVGGIAPRGQIPTKGPRSEAWYAGLSVLEHMRPAGLAYVGRPNFVDDDCLASIQNEAREQENISHRTGPHELSPGGPVASQLAADARLLQLVREAVNVEVEPTHISSYLYYNRAGDHLYPHVDTEIFAVNVILMLEHVIQDGDVDGSALMLYKAGRDPCRVPLRPGEAAVLQAGGTAHGRETIKPGERVTILTLGFQRKDLERL